MAILQPWWATAAGCRAPGSPKPCQHAVQAAAASCRRRRSPDLIVLTVPEPCSLLPLLCLMPFYQVYAQLDKCRAYPDFNSYLAFIFASGEGLPIEVRPACTDVVAASCCVNGCAAAAECVTTPRRQGLPSKQQPSGCRPPPDAANPAAPCMHAALTAAACPLNCCCPAHHRCCTGPPDGGTAAEEQHPHALWGHC